MNDTELYVELDEDGSLLQMHKIVRCKDCALYDREDGLCYRGPNHCGCYRPERDDGFCAWAEPVGVEDGDA